MGYVFIVFGAFVVFSNFVEILSGHFEVLTFILDCIFATCLLGFGFIITNMYKIQKILTEQKHQKDNSNPS